MGALVKFPNKIQEVATLVAAGNVLITDITVKGEIVLEHLPVEEVEIKI